MRTRRTFALATAAALAVSALGGAPAAADEPAETTLLSTEFSSGQLHGWWDNGGAERISFPELDGETVLAVDRAADYHGIQSPHGLLAEHGAGPGDTVVYTAQIRLDEEVEEPVEARWVAHDGGAGHNYQHGQATQVGSAEWTEVTSSFEITEDTDLGAFRAYTGLSDADGLEDYTYYIQAATLVLEHSTEDDQGGDGEDDGLPGEPGWTVVAEYDFADGVGPWEGRGSAQVELTDEAHSGDGALLTTGRSANWHGPQLPFSAIEGFEYNGTLRFTLQVKLPEGAAGTDTLGASLEVPGGNNEYPWVSGRESVGSQEWVELSGEFETEAAAPSAFYVEAEGADTELIIDSVVIEHLPGEDHGGGGDIADSPESLSHDFEDGQLGPWQPRYTEHEDHTVEVTDAESFGGSYSAAVTDRVHQGQGIGAEATEALAPGQQYDLTAWVKFAEGEETDDLWFSAASTTGGSTSYSTLGQFSGLSNSEWVQIEQRFTAPSADELFIYFETAYTSGEAGNTSTFYIDDIEVSRVEAAFDPDLHDPPLKDTVDFPLGVAIDERETTGTASAVANHHFDRLTAENHMKPEAWYAGEGVETFRMHPQTEAILDYAVENDLDVYGHVLVWHSQTPDWFFEVGSPAQMRERMDFHIRSVAEAIYEQYGAFGSETNPVVAWDVVNEVIDDGAAPSRNGMRDSNWFRAYGGDESYVDDAFHFAEQYFNGEFAAEGADRPVALYINDYNTELAGKRERMIGLTERLLERGAPVDGFAHQFHLNLSMPIDNLRQAFNDVEAALPGIPQLVTELDITIGENPTEGLLIDQAYHYRDAFELFRQWSAQHQLDSVAVWGLNDGRSWRAAQLPLIFNDDFSPKPAYTGIIGGELPPRENRAVVFAHDDDAATADPEEYWSRLPLHTTEQGESAFQVYWTQ